MTPGVCFESDSRLPTQKLRGGACTQSFSGVTDKTSFCPFSYMDNQYNWIIENLQGQQAQYAVHVGDLSTAQQPKYSKSAILLSLMSRCVTDLAKEEDRQVLGH